MVVAVLVSNQPAPAASATIASSTLSTRVHAHPWAAMETTLLDHACATYRA